MTQPTSSVEQSRKLAAGIDHYLNAVSDADIRLLRIFCVVVAAGGLSAATGELQADLSTVSRYLKELEDKVGTRLCTRGRSGFALTAQGTLVHQAAQQLFLALKSFRANIDTLQADPVGALRVGVMDALVSDSRFRLPAALRSYGLKAPRVHLSLSVAKPDDIMRLVQSGELDLGVVAARGRADGLAYHPLYLETSSLYCSAQHPYFGKRDEEIGLADCASLDLVEDPYTESLPLRGFAGMFRKGASANSIEAAALLIRSGHYVGFLPDHYAQALASLAPLRRLRPDMFSFEQGIELIRCHGPVNSFVRGLLDELGCA